MDSFRPAAEEPRFEPGATIANYVIEELLGQGTEGSVFVARDTLLGRQVAMKTLRVAEVGETRGVEEARLLASLEHPNIVRVYHARRHLGVWYVVYEYLAGGSLQALLDRVGALPLQQALELLGQAAAGLSFAHGRGILHRDIKPHNLLLSRQGVVKLGDFGLAFDARGERRLQNLVGTPAFLAPEVWQGEPATSASDVFSLGVCSFLLISGRLPFVGNSREQLRQAHAELSPKLPQGLPAPVAELLLGMLAKEPSARPASQELPRLLQQLAEAPYALPQRAGKERRQATSPFSAKGPGRALREVLRTGRDVAYVSELANALASSARGLEVCSAHAADGLLLLDVAREVGAEPRPIAAQLTWSKPRVSLLELLERQLALPTGLSLAEACAELLLPARRLGTGAIAVVHAPRGLSDEQRIDLGVLCDAAAAANCVCVLATPWGNANAEEPRGFRRLLAFTPEEEPREVEERLKLWLAFATDQRFCFSVDALRLAAHYCQSEHRYWASLALQSLLIASAAELPVITTWAVQGAREQTCAWHDVWEVPAAWRKRPMRWPSTAMSAELERLRAQAGGTSRGHVESSIDSLAV